MSRYTKLRIGVSKLEERKQAASRRGSTGLLVGLVLAVVSALLFLASDDFFGLFMLTSILAVFAFVFGVTAKVLGRTEVRKLDASIEKVQEMLAPLEEQRVALLANIRSGDLDALPSFGDYVFQSLPIDLLPSQDELVFRPQKGETCFVQINNVPLGRLKTRTVTRKTGGGYRIGKIYIPVQKERIRVTEMNTLDTGALVITNRRVLYLGAARKLSTKLDKILELQVYQDALTVTKEGRQSADFFLAVDGELLAAIIGGVESTVQRPEI